MPLPSALEATAAILRSTPETVRALTAHLPEDLLRADYGPDTFSPYDVVGHLILGERLDWIPRTRIVLEHGEDRPFDPFPWDGCDEATEGIPLAERIDAFAALRAENLAALVALDLTDDDLDRLGSHPRFGAVSLGQMLTTWGVHDLHHVAQICKALNYQFREAIGPWRPHVNSIPEETERSV
jgi:hypothetical protein